MELLEILPIYKFVLRYRLVTWILVARNHGDFSLI